MVSHVVAAARTLAPERLAVVVGPGMADLVEAVTPVETVVQARALGTADAVKAARGLLSGFGTTGGEADVVVVFGDAATLEGQALHDLVLARREAGAAVSVLGVNVRSANRYGRLIRNADGSLERIVEFHDATPGEKASTLCNSGMMSIEAGCFFDLVDAVDNDNTKGEYYLSDVVEIARARGRTAAVLEIDDPDDTVGADDRVDLARFEAVMQDRLRRRAMLAGCGMPAPETVFPVLGYENWL